MPGTITHRTRVILFTIYILILFTGAGYIVFDPPTSRVLIGSLVNQTAAWLMVSGSVLSLISISTKRVWFETLGIPLISGGIADFSIAALVRVIDGEAVDPAASILVILIRMCLMLFLLDRFLNARKILVSREDAQLKTRR